MSDARVVFHLSDLDKWPVALANAKNLIAASQEIEVEVLVNSRAVAAFATPESMEWSEQLAALQALGVQFLVCANSLKEHQIGPSNLPQGILTVPVGVLALVEKQAEGYAYIKP